MKGSRKRSSRRSATRSAAARSSMLPSKTTNSSPPRRATTSSPRSLGRSTRTPCTRRPATSTSNASPPVCPWVSLMCLKRSRSTNRIASPWRRTLASLMACAKRSENMRRFGNCVSASKFASARICISASLRCVMSCVVPDRRTTWPSSSASTSASHCSVTVWPSAWRTRNSKVCGRSVVTMVCNSERSASRSSANKRSVSTFSGQRPSRGGKPSVRKTSADMTRAWVRRSHSQLPSLASACALASRARLRSSSTRMRDERNR